jgi:hypothetical protein
VVVKSVRGKERAWGSWILVWSVKCYVRGIRGHCKGVGVILVEKKGYDPPFFPNRAGLSTAGREGPLKDTRGIPLSMGHGDGLPVRERGFENPGRIEGRASMGNV